MAGAIDVEGRDLDFEGDGVADLAAFLGAGDECPRLSALALLGDRQARREVEVRRGEVGVPDLDDRLAAADGGEWDLAFVFIQVFILLRELVQPEAALLQGELTCDILAHLLRVRDGVGGDDEEALSDAHEVGVAFLDGFPDLAGRAAVAKASVARLERGRNAVRPVEEGRRPCSDMAVLVVRGALLRTEGEKRLLAAEGGCAGVVLAAGHEADDQDAARLDEGAVQLALACGKALGIADVMASASRGGRLRGGLGAFSRLAGVLRDDAREADDVVAAGNARHDAGGASDVGILQLALEDERLRGVADGRGREVDFGLGLAARVAAVGLGRVELKGAAQRAVAYVLERQAELVGARRDCGGQGVLRDFCAARAQRRAEIVGPCARGRERKGNAQCRMHNAQ